MVLAAIFCGDTSVFLYFVVNLIVMQYYGVLFPENHYFSAKVVLDQLQYLVTYNYISCCKQRAIIASEFVKALYVWRVVYVTLNITLSYFFLFFLLQWSQT